MDTLFACLVLPMEVVCLGLFAGYLERRVCLALSCLHAHVLYLSFHIQLCPHIQYDVHPGSAIAYSTYVFPEEWIDSTFHHCYVPIAVLNTVISTGLSCYSRLGAPYLHYNSDVIERFPEIQQPRLTKSLRMLAFAYPYLFDSTPLFYRLYLCTGESCMESVIPVHYRHCVFAFLTCFIFAAHLPERLAPGRFDYIGHSHQLFHVCGIIGTHFQMEAIFIDMNARRDWLLAASPLLSFSQTAGSIGISIIISLTIIGAFSLALYSTPKSSRTEKLHRH
ncbi:membrane progestin receptor gamma isoform X3 [Trachemys scripta elegans]|uniref:membrane progestin receptor gamma isoform X3 n=1 Tax=Trachemys scripta elegans TaxID=31138 RepID=UPI001555300E|nr:membrane progestin receptor gamma isoform X3 [Trachemys scripta elegans]